MAIRLKVELIPSEECLAHRLSRNPDFLPGPEPGVDATAIQDVICTRPTLEQLAVERDGFNRVIVDCNQLR
jgi:hypothetical protein